MAKINLNITGNYTVKYVKNGQKIRIINHVPQIIDADKKTIIKLSVYEEKNVFTTILKNSLYGFTKIFLICIPSINTAHYKKYYFKVINDETEIDLSDNKLKGIEKYKTFHIDYLIDFISFIGIFIILGLVIYIAIKTHWFEQ